MILAGLIIAAIAALWLAYAAWLASAQNINYRQALVHAPLALVRRVDAHALRNARNENRVIYVVSHQSKIDPALMLALLPDETLHILDPYSARALWLEPWRELARTITFNPEHVFVSRRLVRVLRGSGRLCVYLPVSATPDTREFRLYRAISRIALRADAKVMPIHVSGSGDGKFSKLTVNALRPMTIEELIERNSESDMSSAALYKRVSEVATPPPAKAA